MSPLPLFTRGDTTRHTPIGVSGVVCDVLEMQKAMGDCSPFENLIPPSSTPLMEKIFHVTKLKRKPHIKHHSQEDGLRARFKVPECGVFCHTARLRNHPARLKLVLSDSAGKMPNEGQSNMPHHAMIAGRRLQTALHPNHLGLPTLHHPGSVKR